MLSAKGNLICYRATNKIFMVGFSRRVEYHLWKLLAIQLLKYLAHESLERLFSVATLWTRVHKQFLSLIISAQQDASSLFTQANITQATKHTEEHTNFVAHAHILKKPVFTSSSRAQRITEWFGLEGTFQFKAIFLSSYHHTPDKESPPKPSRSPL